jgi:tetratricopeptide (TPR) repeat protein
VPSFDSISQDHLITQIISRLKRERAQQPAFTLLLGSGFSAPLIPTAGQVVSRDAAWWLFWRQHRERESVFPDPPTNDKALNDFELELWSKVHTECGAGFRLRDGLPEMTADNIGLAYRAIMSGRAASGLSDPQWRRRYLRDLCTRIGDRVNSAHIFMANILRAQDQWIKDGVLKSPFCRTIFTTNFDPLLQRSLQLVNRLYFMSDRPEALEPPEDDDHDAVHLVYSHGSVHRYLLLNTEEEIRAACYRNAAALVPYFQRHGVLVVGYSGWQDAIMTALAQCHSFGGNLYWCDIHAPAEAQRSLSREACSLLENRRGNAFYVPITGADDLMFSLHRELGLGTAPGFISDPIGQLIEELSSVEIPGTSEVSSEPYPLGSLRNARDRTISRLRLARAVFDDPERLRALDAVASTPEAEKLINAAVVAQLEDSAQEKYEAGDFAEAVRLWTTIINDGSDAVSPSQRADALLERGLICLKQGNTIEAIADFDAVLRMPDDLHMQKDSAHFLRGDAFAENGQLGPAFADFSAVLNSDTAPSDIATLARFLLGVVAAQSGQIDGGIIDIVTTLRSKNGTARNFLHAFLRDKIDSNPAPSLDDIGAVLILFAMLSVVTDQIEEAMPIFDFILDKPDMPNGICAAALAMRSLIYRQRNDLAEAIQDCFAMLQLPELVDELRSHALTIRAACLEGSGSPGEALADRTALLELRFLSPEQRCQALIARANTHRMLGDFDNEIADYTSTIEISSPCSESQIIALQRRSISYMTKGKWELAISDLTAVIAVPDVSVQQKVMGFNNRGVAHKMAGHFAEAIADFTMVIEMAESTPEKQAGALLQRGLVKGLRGSLKEAEEDYTSCIIMPSAPLTVRAKALLNRGLSYGCRGQLEEAVVDYTSVIEMADAPIEQRAEALANRGWSRFELCPEDHMGLRDDSEAALVLLPRLALARSNLGIALLLSNEPECAAAEYRQLLSETSSRELRQSLRRYHENLNRCVSGQSIKGAAEILALLEGREAELGGSGERKVEES